jgi:hypothetical protein
MAQISERIEQPPPVAVRQREVKLRCEKLRRLFLLQRISRVLERAFGDFHRFAG